MDHRSASRCCATWLVATLATALLVAWVLPDLHDAARGLLDLRAGRSTAPFAAWLTWWAAVAVAGCSLWGWWITTVVVAEALTGRERPAVPGVPAWARRAVLTACGALVVGAVAPGAAAAVPAPADAGGWGRHGAVDPSGRPTGERALDGLPLPDRAEGPSASQAVARALAEQRAATPRSARPPAPQPERPSAPPAAVPADPPADPPAAPPPGPRTRSGAAPAAHVVRPGESLWSIAEAAWARSTGAPAGTAEVAAYWPQVYAANRAVLGPEPDLIRPGQPLRIPPPPARGEDTR